MPFHMQVHFLKFDITVAVLLSEVSTVLASYPSTTVHVTE